MRGIPDAPPSRDSLADDLAAFRLPPDAFAAQVDSLPSSQDFVVFRENKDAVAAFLACRTQWRREVPGLGAQWVWHGLRYTECEAVIRNLGHQGKRGQAIFQELQVMESAALPILNKPTGNG